MCQGLHLTLTPKFDTNPLSPVVSFDTTACKVHK